jgi:hypothetical protein
MRALGEKNEYIKPLSTKVKQKISNFDYDFIKEKLKEVYNNTTKVEDIKYNLEEEEILDLLRKNKDDIITDKYIILNSLESPKFDSLNDTKKDMINIYNQLSSTIDDFQPKDLKFEKDKIIGIGSFGINSIQGDYLSNKYNIPHITFNPMLLKTNSKIFKIRGDAYSLFSFNPKDETTFEILKDYKNLNHNANNINNL